MACECQGAQKGCCSRLVMNWNCNCGVFFLLGFFLTTLFSSRKFFWCGVVFYLGLGWPPALKLQLHCLASVLHFVFGPPHFELNSVINFCFSYDVCCGCMAVLWFGRFVLYLPLLPNYTMLRTCVIACAARYARGIS